MGSKRRGPKLALLGLAVALLAGCGPAPAPTASSPQPTTITAVELSERIGTGDAPLILDVRSVSEFEAGHIPGATHIPHDQMKARIGELPEDRTLEIVVHCQSGRRAEFAEAELIAAGYENVRDLDGHWASWSAAGLARE